eukprot:3002400-Alexandrium_andersonii.AAC.1
MEGWPRALNLGAAQSIKAVSPNATPSSEIAMPCTPQQHASKRPPGRARQCAKPACHPKASEKPVSAPHAEPSWRRAGRHAGTGMRG